MVVLDQSADTHNFEAIMVDLPFELVLWLPKGDHANPPRRTYATEERDNRVIWSK